MDNDFIEYFRIMTAADGDPVRQQSEEAMARFVYGRFTELASDASRSETDRANASMYRDALVACLREFVRDRDLVGASWQRRFLDEHGFPITSTRKPS